MKKFTNICSYCHIIHRDIVVYKSTYNKYIKLEAGSGYMFYWAYMLVMVLIMPVIMIVLGALFLHKPPKNINMFFGYRTPMSVKNIDTWRFAHRVMG